MRGGGKNAGPNDESSGEDEKDKRERCLDFAFFFFTCWSCPCMRTYACVPFEMRGFSTSHSLTHSHTHTPPTRGFLYHFDYSMRQGEVQFLVSAGGWSLMQAGMSPLHPRRRRSTCAMHKCSICTFQETIPFWQYVRDDGFIIIIIYYH